MMKKLLFLFSILTLICGWTVAAEGHGMSLFASPDGKTISGTAKYHAGGPVVDAEVTITGQEGKGDVEKKFWKTRTDKEGKFVIEVSPCKSYLVVLDQGGGHRAETTVQGTLGTANVNNTQIDQLRREIHDLKHSIRLRDILGGIGYILGLVGIGMYFKAKERHSRPRYPSPNRDQPPKQHDESD